MFCWRRHLHEYFLFIFVELCEIVLLEEMNRRDISLIYLSMEREGRMNGVEPFYCFCHTFCHDAFTSVVGVHGIEQGWIVRYAYDADEANEIGLLTNPPKDAFVL